jgi:hypothetical protein
VKKPDVIQKNELYFCNQGSNVIQNQLSKSKHRLKSFVLQACVMVWGGITLNGRTELVVLPGGSLTAVRYLRDIVERHVVPFAENMGRDFILQQDNARPHIAGVVRNCFNDHNIEVIQWPANSPDLNPNEHLWDTLNKRIREHQPI